MILHHCTGYPLDPAGRYLRFQTGLLFVVTSRLPSFVELVEKFLIIFQDALSGLNDSEKEEMAVCLIPEVCIFNNNCSLHLCIIEA